MFKFIHNFGIELRHYVLRACAALLDNDCRDASAEEMVMLNYFFLILVFSSLFVWIGCIMSNMNKIGLSFCFNFKKVDVSNELLLRFQVIKDFNFIRFKIILFSYIKKECFLVGVSAKFNSKRRACKPQQFFALFL